MNAIEKFEICYPEGKTVKWLKSGVQIPIHHEFFRARRKVMRGLEEHIVRFDHPEDTGLDHDYINGTYVYELKNVEGKSIYIRFEPEWVIFGSDILYGA